MIALNAYLEMQREQSSAERYVDLFVHSEPAYYRQPCTHPRIEYIGVHYRFDGDDCNEPGGCMALCSLKDDCLRRLAGVGNGSGLTAEKGVGSSGREGIGSSRGFFCKRFEARSSAVAFHLATAFNG